MVETRSAKRSTVHPLLFQDQNMRVLSPFGDIASSRKDNPGAIPLADRAPTDTGVSAYPPRS